jgi:ABC-2 type transport system permease protein
LTGFGALVKKELTEQLRAWRLLTYVLVLLVTGIGSMVAIRYLPEILEATGGGGDIVIPEFNAAEAMLNYGSNVVQMGTLATVLLAMGAVARERENGTAIITLTKPISVAAYILAKIAAHFTSIAIAVIGVSSVAYAYGVGLFEGDIGAGVVWYVATLLLFLWFAVAITIGISCFFRSQIAVGVLSLVGVVALSATAGLPWIGRYLPGAVLGWGNDALISLPGMEPRWIALVAMVATAAAAVALGWLRLRTTDV